MNFDDHIRRIRPCNTRQQDVFLLAKGHYDATGERSRTEDARRLLALHQGVFLEHMRWQDVAYMVATDLEPLIAPELKGRHFVEFLLGFGPNIVPSLSPDYTQPGQGFAVVVERLLSRVSLMQVRRDGEWLLPFPEPTVDAAIVQALDAAREADEAARQGKAA